MATTTAQRFQLQVKAKRKSHSEHIIGMIVHTKVEDKDHENERSAFLLKPRDACDVHSNHVNEEFLKN